jgi:hypothetical protein
MVVALALLAGRPVWWCYVTWRPPSQGQEELTQRVPRVYEAHIQGERSTSGDAAGHWGASLGLV